MSFDGYVERNSEIFVYGHVRLIDIQAFDKNHDGYIDEHELRQTMHELGMKLSAEDIKSMMSQAGCRITGRVYYEGLSLCL